VLKVEGARATECPITGDAKGRNDALMKFIYRSLVQMCNNDRQIQQTKRERKLYTRQWEVNKQNMPNTLTGTASSIIQIVLKQHFNDLRFLKPVAQPFYTLVIRKKTHLVMNLLFFQLNTVRRR